MPTADILAGDINFEDYGSSNSNLQSQGTPPYTWSVTNSVGQAPAVSARINTNETGTSSGIVMIRQSSNTQGAQKAALGTLVSGIPSIGGDVEKIIFIADFSVDKDGANPSKNDILLRPSGTNFDSGYYGWRAGLWVRANPEPNDRIILQRLVASANGEVFTHFIPKTAYSGTMTLRVTDDGSTMEVYANASGTFELIHSVTSSVYNDHNPSGILAFSRDGGTQNTMVDNYRVLVTSGFITPGGGGSSLGQSKFVNNQQSNFIKIF